MAYNSDEVLKLVTDSRIDDQLLYEIIVDQVDSKTISPLFGGAMVMARTALNMVREVNRRNKLKQK